jgi:hypothetical protein
MIKLSGKIIEMFPMESFGTREKPFKKVIFWLQEISDMYPNSWQLEFWQEDCTMASTYKVGDFVTCYVDIKGKLFEKRDGSGQGIITSLKCWNVEKEGKTYKEIKA